MAGVKVSVYAFSGITIGQVKLSICIMNGTSWFYESLKVLIYVISMNHCNDINIISLHALYDRMINNHTLQ